MKSNSRGVRTRVHQLHLETHNLWYYLEAEGFTTIEHERVFLSVTSPFTCPCPEKKGMPTHRVSSASPITIQFFPMLISASCHIVPAHFYLNSLRVFWSSKPACQAIPILIHSSCWSQPYLITQIYRADKQLTDTQIIGRWESSASKFRCYISLICVLVLLRASKQKLALVFQCDFLSNKFCRNSQEAISTQLYANLIFNGSSDSFTHLCFHETTRDFERQKRRCLTIFHCMYNLYINVLFICSNLFILTAPLNG